MAYTALTISAARDLGRTLTFYKHHQDVTVREIAQRAGLSFQYVSNILTGTRRTVEDEVYRKLAHGLGIPEDRIANLVLKARMVSALENRGLNEAQATEVWEVVERKLRSQGHRINTDLAKIVAELM